jgi:hypothetical protein
MGNNCQTNQHNPTFVLSPAADSRSAARALLTFVAPRQTLAHGTGDFGATSSGAFE